MAAHFEEMPDSLERALAALRCGSVIVLVDNSTNRISAYLLAAALAVSADDVCLMVNYGRGVISAVLTESRIRELGLPMMAPRTNSESPEFTVSVEARHGVSTGISAADRAQTLRTLAKTTTPQQDLVSPGHIFPLRARNGGVLVRSAPAEAAVDLLQLAGLPPVAAFCHLLTSNGELADENEIGQLVAQTGLCAITMLQVIRERLARESIIEKIAEARLPTAEAGEFRAHCFRSKTDGAEHIALVKGDLAGNDGAKTKAPVLVRVQAEHPISDLLGTNDFCGRQRLHSALKRIDEVGQGVFIYIRHSPEVQLRERLNRTLQGSSGSASKLKEYGIGAQILNFLGVDRIKLLTNSRHEPSGIAAFGIQIIDRVSF